MFGSAEWSKPSNNRQCKQQMLDWIKARWTESVYSSPMQSHPFSLCCWGQIHPFFWHATLASLHNDEPALLLSPRIITCDRRTDAQVFFFFSLCFSTLAGFSLFFPHLCQDLSLAVAPSCIHRTDPLWAFQTNLMGFLQHGEKLRGFLQFASCRWKLVSYGSVFKPLSVNVGFRYHLGAL